MTEIKLRESDPPGRVIVFVDDVEVGRHGEYRAAADWLERNHPAAWAQQHREAYRDYKDDSDER